MKYQGGGLMIEILVTIAIVIIGLWGLLDMQARLQLSEVESYQRTQALLLVDDMAERIATNRINASGYVTTTPLGAPGTTCTASALTDPLDKRDTFEWCQAIQGASERIGTNVGTLVNGRGCIEAVDTGSSTQYMVTIVWQGLTPIATPPTTVSCGSGQYNLPVGSECESQADACRRFVTKMVRLADLTDL